MGRGLGNPPPGFGWPFPFPFPLPWSCLLCFFGALRRLGGTWFQVLPVKTGVVNGSIPSGTNMFSA